MTCRSEVWECCLVNGDLWVYEMGGDFGHNPWCVIYDTSCGCSIVYQESELLPEKPPNPLYEWVPIEAAMELCRRLNAEHRADHAKRMDEERRQG